MKNKRIEIIVISAVLILQTVLYIVFGTQKAYIHMDEAYSFGLASYDKTEIQDNADFYNNWHDSDYFADYLRVDEDEIYDFSPVYKNQINDVHPPLYYLLLRLFMGASVGTVTFWTGLVLNIIISLLTENTRKNLPKCFGVGGGSIVHNHSLNSLPHSRNQSIGSISKMGHSLCKQTKISLGKFIVIHWKQSSV